MSKLRNDAIKSFVQTEKKGGFATSDGNIFPSTKEGHTFAKSHASGLEDRSVFCFDQEGKEVVAKTEKEVRSELEKILGKSYKAGELANMSLETMAALAENVGQGGDSGEIDLEKMNKAQLIELLVQLDPTEDKEAHVKAKTGNDKLKGMIEVANSLTGFDLEKLRVLAVEFGAESESIENLDAEDLKAVVLHKRDGVDLPEAVFQKMNSITGDVDPQ